MNTNTIIGIVAGIILIGGAFYVMNRTPGGDTMMEAKNEEGTAGSAYDESAQPGLFSGSILDLAARGGDWKCTVDSSVSAGAAQAVSSGMVYVSGSKVRADFTSAVQGFGDIETHMIGDGEYTYTWTSVLPQGFKAKMTKGDSSATATSGQGADANQSYAYDCQPSQAEASLFSVPSNITFQAI